MSITRRTMLSIGALGLAGSIAPGKIFASNEKPPQKARYWHSTENSVTCDLCPHRCVLVENKIGRCQTRQNIKGALVTNAYANPCALHIDPIEKKPFYHFLPATQALSLAIAGCNLRCLNCQNYTISQRRPDQTESQNIPPEKAVELAISQGCASIAYTYSEPIVWYEYMLDTAQRAHSAGLKNILVTAGFINEAPLRQLLEHIDAITLDIKSFSDTTYRKLNSGTLDPILKTLCTIKKSNVWLEISTLIIPGWTDDPDMIRKMCVWIKQNLGNEIPFHILRFHPVYRLANLYPTPTATLKIAQKIAKDEGLFYVYAGNAAEIDSNTYCPACKKMLITRDLFLTKTNIIHKNFCPNCKKNISGVWTI